MRSIKLSFAQITCFFTLACMLHSTHAQNSEQDYLAAHNAARAQVGVGPMVWNSSVAGYAQDYANQRMSDCNLIHSGGPYGENLASISGGGDLTGQAAVDLWVSEKTYYDHSTNTCAEGKTCGHYTQVVWRNSVQLGCARVQCSNNGWFVICSYYPPGNYVGESPY